MDGIRPEVFMSRGLSFSVDFFSRIFIDLSLFGFYIKLLCCCLQWIISISFSVILMRLVLWNLDRDRWIIFIGLGLDLVQWFGISKSENVQANCLNILCNSCYVAD